MGSVRLLFLGDIVGKPGRRIVNRFLPDLVQRYEPHLILANGENAAGGFGLTRPVAEELLAAGIAVITTGNHVWDKKEILEFIDEMPRLLRPANYPEGVPGQGWCLVPLGEGLPPVAVINLMGRTFLSPLEDPFRSVDQLLSEIGLATPLVVVDFHAEATAEKVAMGWHLDGRATAVVGTHTHVPTADERVLPSGTAYITDLGMCGPLNGVLGMEIGPVLRRFLTQMPARFDVAPGPAWLNGVLIEADAKNGRATGIQRIQLQEEGPAAEGGE